MREKVEYGVLQLFLFMARITPKRCLYAVIRGATMSAYHLGVKRRRMTLSNLSLAFPDKTSQEVEELAKAVYRNLSETITEILLMYVGRFDIDEAVINKDEAIQKIEWLKIRAKHGIVVITAHFSNWELAAHFLAKHGLPMLAVGREGNNKLIDSHVTVPFRNKYGNRATTKKKAMLAMAKALKNGETVGLLIDQKAGENNSAKVDFFGVLAETTLSVALLKQKFDPLIVPVFIVREARGQYRMLIEPPIDDCADASQDEEAQRVAMTACYSAAIEKVIRTYPQQWFWMHNRWRR